MTVHRFFVEPGETRADRFPLPATIEHRVRRVLRLRDDDAIVLLPGDGTAVTCRLDGAECVVIDRGAAGGEPRHRLAVVQALLKGDALEELVRQGTELGVARFRLVVADRCVATELSSRKLARLGAIAREAAEQSERGRVPPIEGPVSLAEALEPGAAFLYERGAERRLTEVPPPSSVVIGPEGGFTDDEVEAARVAGASIVGLGPRILRARSVALAATAVILSRSGDFA